MALVFGSRTFFERGAASFLVLMSGGVIGGCKNSAQKPATNSSPAGSAKSLSVPAGQDPVLVGAGDIAFCGDLAGAEATAKLLDSIPGVVFTAGDNAYENGTAQEFKNCYQPTWGRHKDRTRPAVGNHEFHSNSATPYSTTLARARGIPARVITATN